MHATLFFANLLLTCIHAYRGFACLSAINGFLCGTMLMMWMIERFEKRIRGK